MKTKVLYLGLIFFCLAAQPAQALKISPFKAALQLTEAAPVTVFRVENNADEPAAVQVSAETWRIAADGQESNESAEDKFVIFPAQFVLKPRESRAVRVQWQGGAALAAEQAYRLVVEQLPVQLQATPGGGSSVKFLLKFRAALYVTQGKGESDITVADVSEMSDQKLRLTLENKGAVHTLLRDPRLHLSLSDGQAVTLTGDAVKALSDENMHAASTRQFILPLPPAAAGRVVSAKLDFIPGF